MTLEIHFTSIFEVRHVSTFLYLVIRVFTIEPEVFGPLPLSMSNVFTRGQAEQETSIKKVCHSPGVMISIKQPLSL